MKRFSILFTLIIYIVSSICCSDFDNNNSTQEQISELPDQESWDAKMYFTREGKRQAVLLAGYIAKYSAKKYTLLKEGVRVDFYDIDGNLKSTLTSDQAKVYDNNQDMIANGDVHVVSRNGRHLYSEELIWKNKEEQIISNVPVKITTQNDTLYGDNFKSDPDLINYELTNVRATSDKTISIDE